MSSDTAQPDSVTAAALPDDPEERRRRYNKTVREARLRSLVLEDVRFTADPSALSADDDDEARKSSCRGDMVSFYFDLDTKTCLATIQWRTEVKRGKARLAKCTAKYTVLYDSFAEDEDIVRLFVENVAQPATYTYFRALYANLDWAADVRSPPLPILRFIPKV